MPASFPETDFRRFGTKASQFFPSLTSNEALLDPQEKRRHFDRSWQAVRYRYRTCAKCNDEFRCLLESAGAEWRAEGSSEELAYELERCIYIFFMSGLSVFESFGFCLYFLGGALRPENFPLIANPKRITPSATASAYKTVFPDAAITSSLMEVLADQRFAAIDQTRNLLAHRLSGRRSVRAWSNGVAQGREDTWHIPGSSVKLVFDDTMLEGQMDGISAMVGLLATTARQFVENYKRQT